uniref:Uncharacterized protein n=1 Tax=Neisseria meningitidis alpha275 TaxID=295996 RepID=C6SMG8_NEIME|nr:hypothetical protein predicted by Glimmer/Critica [Neisseria meningitidis alpha275]
MVFLKYRPIWANGFQFTRFFSSAPNPSKLCNTSAPRRVQKVDGFSFGFDAELNVRFDLRAV